MASLAVGCIGEGQPLPARETDDDAGVTLLEAGVANQQDAAPDQLAPDPHSLLNVDPPHGPFAGGQLATVRGTGFGGDARFWFGEAEVPSEQVVTASATLAQVTVPAGRAGPVDVTTQNGDDTSTRRTLHAGYIYDAFSVSPSSGPSSGGTIVALQGQQTNWDANTTVLIDLVACTDVEWLSAAELNCVTPPGSVGSKSVRVRTGAGVDSDVLDAFTYIDSDNGFRGGLSGEMLSNRLTVLALDNASGAVLSEATVILGEDLSGAQLTDNRGLAVFEDTDLGPVRTVSVAKPCFQPITFVNVPVDTVTAYLDPVLSPRCAEQGDPPPTGGVSAERATVEGELVWPSSVEFTRQGWTNVPPPAAPNARYVAYLLRPDSDPTRDFALPSEGNAVTLDSEGTIGYAFSSTGSAGNLTLYALAGIEDRQANPPMFLAYTMGVAQGIRVEPGDHVSEVFVPMNIPLDHMLDLQVDGPSPTARGPDRVLVDISVSLGEAGYALFPQGARSHRLPVDSELSFVGLPPLCGALLGSQYIITASAVTGEAELSPRSVLARLARTTSSGVVDLSDFVEVPVLEQPTEEVWDARGLTVNWQAGGRAVDVIVVRVFSGEGLVRWTVAAPADSRQLRLPALDQLDPELSLIQGPVQIVVNLASIDEFDYGALRYRHLVERGWTAYARDTYHVRYAP